VAAGELVAALAVPWSTAPDVGLPALRVEGDRLTGTVTSVAGAIEADVLLVAASSGLYAVDVSAVTVTPRVCLDMTRQLADVTLDGVSGVLVLADAEPAVRRALDSGAALMASEQLGVARWCLDTTVDYLKVRKQFGRVLGGFQALKHRLADLYTDVESGAAAARYAAATLAAGDPDATVATSIAQAYNSDLAVRAAEEAVQLHGGIGMTWEHPAHLYLKRAKADQIALGTPGRHRARLGALVDLGA
jgi:alkylation response protein AidB-like acyl-CoA dehydrogenase